MIPEARRRSGCSARGAWTAWAFGAAVLLLGPGASLGWGSVESVSVEPKGRTVAPGRTLSYTATARMTDGSTIDVTDDAAWETSDEVVARFDPDVPGALRVRRPGQTRITATVAGKRATTRLTADPGEVVGLVTRPGNKKLELDRPREFTARLVYDTGYQEDVTEECAWSSSDKTVARVNNAARPGRVVPKSLGTTFIKARHRSTGLKNTDGDTRVLPPIDRVRFEDATVVLGRGMTTDLRVMGDHGRSGERTRIDEEDLRFTVDDPAILDVVRTGKDAGQITALRDGITIVRAYDRVRKLGTGKRRAIVVIVAGLLEGLEVLPDPFKVNAADTRNASVVGLLSSGLRTGDLRKQVEWRVVDSEVARVGNGEDDVGEVEGKGAGTTTLRARFPEFDVVSEQVDNLIVRGRVTSVAIEPEAATIGIDLSYPLDAYANRDDEGRSNIASSASWSSDPEGVVAIDGEGRITGLANGNTVVTAVDPKTGFEDSIPVTVAGRLASIEVPDLRLEKGDEKKAKALGTLTSGLRTSDLRPIVDWKMARTTIALVGDGELRTPEGRRLDPGEVYGQELGTTTLTATEPRSGLKSRESGNVTVRAPGGSTPGPNPGPTPIAPPPVRNVSVVVEPGNDAQVPSGQTVTYKARATRSDGSKKNISDKCSWSIDDPAIATVDDVLPKKGAVTGLVIGTTTVRIDCDGLLASGPVDVVGDVIGLEILPSSFSGEIGTDKQLRARVHFSGGGEDEVTREIDWSSTNPDVATVENEDEAQKGRVRFHALGEALIFAVDATGHVATSTATVDR